MQRGRQPGGVGVPEQDVECRRLLAEQVVVHPVVPDEVPRAEPGEDLGEGAPVQVALASRRLLGQLCRARAHQRRRPAGALVVEHRDEQRERGQPVLLSGAGEVPGRQGGEDAAGADAGERDLLRFGQPFGGVHGLEDRPHVGVGVPVGVDRLRVPPGHHEHLLALTHQVLHQAAAGREVDRVELVDRRRDEQQGHGTDLGCLRRVPDELEDLGPQDDGARCGRDVPAELEGGAVDHLGDPRRRGHVGDEVLGPTDEIQPAAVDHRLGRGGVEERDVARGERLHEVLDEEACAFVVPPVEIGVGDQAIGSPTGREVGLDDPAQHGIRRPCLVGEAPVTPGRRDRRPAQRDLRELGGERADPPGGHGGAGRERGEQPGRGEVGREAAEGAEGGLDQQCVEWRGHVVVGGRARGGVGARRRGRLPGRRRHGGAAAGGLEAAFAAAWSWAWWWWSVVDSWRSSSRS